MGCRGFGDEQLAPKMVNEQGSRLAHGPGHGQEVAGDEPGQRAAQHDRPHHPGAAHPEGQARLPQVAGHGPHGRLAGPDDDGQHEHGQGEAPGQSREVADERTGPDEHGVGEDAHGDRGHPGEHVGGEPQRAGEPAPALEEEQRGTSMPTGTAMAAARPTMITEPTMALEMPPPGMPGGVGTWVRKAHDSAWMPRLVV